MITKHSITRITRKAGIKSVSNDCYPVIQNSLIELVTKVISTALIINSEKNTKTLMTDDIYDAIRINGDNITQSSDLNNIKSKKI